MQLGNSILNNIENKLYVYELYDLTPGESSIVEIDLDNPNKWTSLSVLEGSKQKHHHNVIFNEKDKKIIFLEVMDIFDLQMNSNRMT